MTPGFLLINWNYIETNRCLILSINGLIFRVMEISFRKE
jgi:hypothetical protein